MALQHPMDEGEVHRLTFDAGLSRLIRRKRTITARTDLLPIHSRRRGDDDELAGRLCAVEVIAMMAMGMYLANAKNDPDYSKAGAIIEVLRRAVVDQLPDLPEGARPYALAYSGELLDTLSRNLRTLRGEGGSTH
jgi:hypothetical protein